MTYSWNGENMWDVATLPSGVSKFLKIAGPTQLRVLLWFATIGKGRGDAVACSEYLGGRISPDECEDALRFWAAEGILLAEGTKPIRKKDEVVEKKEEPKPQETKKPTPRIVGASSPSKAVSTITQRHQNSKEFRYLLESTEICLGKVLNRADQDRLLDIYDTLKMPVEVILMAMTYAAQKGKGTVSYVQAVCKSWAEEGITTVQKADEHLCYLERTDKCWDQLNAWLDVDCAKVTITQKQMAEKWLSQWKLRKPILQLAYTRTMEKTGKFQASYMNKLLDSWYTSGLVTPEKVEAYEGKNFTPAKNAGNKRTSIQPGGFDAAQYANVVKNHTPKFRKKG